MREFTSKYVSNKASEFVRDTVDKVYLEDNYHCCTTSEFEIWHIGDCCPYLCGCAKVDGQQQAIFCGDLWEDKKLLSLTLRGNDFLSILQARGAASCVIETRRPHIIWGHGNNIYNTVIPEQFRAELVAAAKVQKLYSKPSILGVYVNNKIPA